MCIAEQKVCHTKECMKEMTRSQNELPFCPLGVMTKEDEVKEEGEANSLTDSKGYELK